MIIFLIGYKLDTFLWFNVPYLGYALERTEIKDPDEMEMETAEIWSYALQLLSLTVGLYNRFPIIKMTMKQPGFLENLVSLVRSRHTFLRLQVIKLVKQLIELSASSPTPAGKKFYFSIIERDNLLAPILETYMADYTDRDNIAESTVRSLFQCIVDIKDRVRIPYY